MKIGEIMAEINKNVTQEEFARFAEWFLNMRVLPTLKEKGKQYSNGEAFVNFIEGSTLHDVTPGSYLMIMATKHWHNLCKNPNVNQEERIRDIIVYMLLLEAMHTDIFKEPTDSFLQAFKAEEE